MLTFYRDLTFITPGTLHKIPCISTENCIEPPKAGSAITVTTTDFEDSDWMKTEAEFQCTDPEAFFYEKDLDFEASFSLICEKSMIFGGKFPYWQIPGTNYPEKTEVICAHTKKCYNFATFDPAIKKYGLTDTFDNFHFEKDAKFQYYCSNQIRGKRKFYIH